MTDSNASKIAAAREAIQAGLEAGKQMKQEAAREERRARLRAAARRAPDETILRAQVARLSPEGVSSLIAYLEGLHAQEAAALPVFDKEKAERAKLESITAELSSHQGRMLARAKAHRAEGAQDERRHRGDDTQVTEALAQTRAANIHRRLESMRATHLERYLDTLLGWERLTDDDHQAVMDELQDYMDIAINSRLNRQGDPQGIAWRAEMDSRNAALGIDQAGTRTTDDDDFDQMIAIELENLCDDCITAVSRNLSEAEKQLLDDAMILKNFVDIFEELTDKGKADAADRMQTTRIHLEAEQVIRLHPEIVHVQEYAERSAAAHQDAQE